MYFTNQEMTIRKKTIGEAVAQASKVLFLMHNEKEVCMDAVGLHVDLKTPITVREMSDIVEKIVDDSLYYSKGNRR
jgi:hypothetical protein